MRVSGLSQSAWVELWVLCYQGAKRIAWPDGKSTIEQPSIVVHMFSLVVEQWIAEQDSGK